MSKRVVAATFLGVGILSTLAWGQPSPASAPAGKPEMVWQDAGKLTVEGRGWTDTAEFWDRLPGRAKSTVPASVWGLSKDSAGLAVRFVTDSPKITARWTLTSSSLAMPHMPATGVSGLDLYVRHEGAWRWAGAGRPGSTTSNEAVLVGNAPPGEHEYMLYLPLYNGIKSLEIGIPAGVVLKGAPRRGKPIVFYGTSICQGGCASRPGMVHTAILGRRLDCPTINLGFSGSGKMEPALADLLAELDPASYVLDCLPNMTAQMVAERVEPFVRTLRKARPNTPIFLGEQAPHGAGVFLTGQRDLVAAKNRELRKAFDRLKADGVTNLIYVPGDTLLGRADDATVDGVHATDLGFERMGDAWEPVLRQILSKR